MSKVKILFVCLGNICRSPAAEAVMTKLVQKANLNEQITCDSAATSAHHEGDPTDPRTIEHAQKRGYAVTSISRPFNHKRDFDEFDYIITMDDTNHKDVLNLDSKKRYSDKVFKLADFSPTKKFTHVPDPYYEGPESFELVMDILEETCAELLHKIKAGSL